MAEEEMRQMQAMAAVGMLPGYTQQGVGYGYAQQGGVVQMGYPVAQQAPGQYGYAAQGGYGGQPQPGGYPPQQPGGYPPQQGGQHQQPGYYTH